VDDLWATKSEDVGLIVRAISFQDFQPMWSWSTNFTDGQTDRRTQNDMQSQDCALHYSASHGISCSKNCNNTQTVNLQLRYTDKLWGNRNAMQPEKKPALLITNGTLSIAKPGLFYGNEGSAITGACIC